MEGSSAIIKVLQFLQHVDKDVTLAVNSCHCPASDVFWNVMSHVQIWYVLYLAVIVLLIWRLGWKKGLVAVGACVLMVVACDQLGNLVKDAVCRLRPLHDLEMVSRGLHILEPADEHLYGFFSAHAANTMGFAVCSSICLCNDKKHSYKAYYAGIAVWAVLVGISRVFVGKHFVGDVLAGWFVGILLGAAFGLVASYIIKKVK